jgi:uncharacterized hydrophobic protein (TIGR00341 family)
VRLVQITVPAGKRETILAALDDHDIDYVVTDETSGREFDALVSFPLPTNAVEPVLDDLRETGVDRDAYTVVLDAETVISERFEQLRDQYAEENGDDDRIAREELRTKAEDLAPALPNYVILTVVSAVIATAGLLLDSPAVVVGSMVIAPLVGPAMAASVGTVVDDGELFVRGVKLQALGMGLAIVSAAVFAWAVKTIYLIPPGTEITAIPEIRERLTPDFLSLVVALGAGVAGVLSLSTGVSTALVGVMIAVALMPPAATVGIGLAFGQPVVSLGAGVLALVNGLSINLAALVVLWYRGYRPERWFRLSETRSRTIKRVAALALAIAVLSAFLGGVTYTAFQNGTFEENARTAIDDELAERPGLSVLSFEVEYGQDVLFQTPERVVVVVGHEAGAESAELDTALRRQIAAETGRNVAVTVRYQRTETAGRVGTGEPAWPFPFGLRPSGL